jgi:hypothetical protein
MTARAARALRAGLAIGVLLACLPGATAAAPPPPNTVSRWDEIAQNTVVSSGAFQNEGLVYMAYVSAAVYDAATSIQGRYEPYGHRIRAPRGASTDAAVIEAASRTLVYYFPAPRAASAPDLDALHSEALAEIPSGRAKDDGIAVGAAAAAEIIALRADDGRVTPIGSSSPFSPVLGPGVWRRTPPAFAPPQTPGVGAMRPFLLRSPGQFPPGPPPALPSRAWVRGVGQVRAYGGVTASARSAEQTDIARFWSTNVIAQYNQALRELAAARGLGLLETARLMAMVNVVGADAQIAVMDAKYHYAFWRPVTAIDPGAVSSLDGGPAPGYEDRNPATVEQNGWRPLLTTPNHPEYPAAHGSLTSSMVEVFSEFLGPGRFDLTLSSTVVPSMPTRHFNSGHELRREIVDARLWGGLHYRFSTRAGVRLGRDVARYDLAHAFRPAGSCRTRTSPGIRRRLGTRVSCLASSQDVVEAAASPVGRPSGRGLRFGGWVPH